MAFITTQSYRHNFTHTRCGESCFESLVCGGRITVALKMHPNHVPSAEHVLWLIGATRRPSKDGSISSFHSFHRIAKNLEVSLSDLHVIVFAVLALF